jgi:hypothetical protein
MMETHKWLGEIYQFVMNVGNANVLVMARKGESQFEWWMQPRSSVVIAV